MSDQSFPTAKALLLAFVIAVVHYAMAYAFLVCAVSGMFVPALIGFWLLAFPLIATVSDLASKSHPVAWWLNSLIYGFIIAWIYCTVRWSRRAKGVVWWQCRIEWALIGFGLIALLLGEVYHPVTAADDAQSERNALRRAEAADKSAENLRAFFAKFRQLGRRDREEWAERIQREEAVARQEKAVAAYYSRLKRYPGTRGPGLIVLALGGLVWSIAYRQRRRAASGMIGLGRDSPVVLWH
jgi:hypothetical protein